MQGRIAVVVAEVETRHDGPKMGIECDDVRLKSLGVVGRDQSHTTDG